jgi:hypothetical protein
MPEVSREREAFGRDELVAGEGPEARPPVGEALAVVLAGGEQGEVEAGMHI